MTTGLFLTFEGIDGCGKSTQLRLLANRLRAAGHEVVETAEPGGTRIGAQIRQVLLDPANRELSPVSELLLYFASRAQAVDEIILPALSQGKIVLSDRFTDSSVAYQGWGRDLGEDTVLKLDLIGCRGLVPDLTIFVDVDVDTALARARAGGSGDRIEEQARAFHDRVLDGYASIARSEPKRFQIVDGRASVEEVAERVWSRVEAVLAKR